MTHCFQPSFPTKKGILMSCHCTVPESDIYGTLHETRYSWRSARDKIFLVLCTSIVVPTSFLHCHWRFAQSIAICFLSSRDALVLGPTDSAPFSRDRTTQEHHCLGFTIANSYWDGSNLKAHGPLDGLVWLGLFPTIFNEIWKPKYHSLLALKNNFNAVRSSRVNSIPVIHSF